MCNSFLRTIRIISILIFFFAGLLSFTKPVLAETAGSSAVLTTTIATTPSVPPLKKDDQRVHVLQKFLTIHGSPLSDYAQTFITEADKNGIDWKLLPAIAGVESTFGINIPADSYNGWGFGIYGDNVRRFTSWNDAIATISKSLREDYIDKWGATDVYAIGRIYAASPTWADRVTYFMNQIDASMAADSDQNQTLSLSF